MEFRNHLKKRGEIRKALRVGKLKILNLWHVEHLQ